MGASKKYHHNAPWETSSQGLRNQSPLTLDTGQDTNEEATL